jgi:ligand-binding sensor domain-containing protein
MEAIAVNRKSYCSRLGAVVAMLALFGVGEVSAQSPRWKIYRPTNTGTQGNYSFGVVADSAGRLWANGHDPVWDEGGLVMFDGSSWHNWSTVDSAAPDEELRAFKMDAGGNIWMGSGAGLLKFDGTSFTVYNHSTVPGFPCDTVHDVDIDPSGNVWFAMENFNENNGGVGRFDGTNWTFWYRGQGHPMPDPWNPVMSIACGPNGEVYAGAASVGVARYENGTWTYLGNEHGGQVNDIVVDSTGVAWFAMIHALVSYDHGTWTEHGSDGPLGLASRSAGGLWVGLAGGLYYYHNSVWTNMNWPGGFAYDVAESPDGSLWATGIGGIAHYAGGKWTLYNTYNTGLTDFSINAIDFDSHRNVWVSAVGGGLCRFDGEAWRDFSPYNGGSEPWPYPTDGVEAAVEALDGKIWAATYAQGVVVWDGTNWVAQYADGAVVKDVIRDSTGVIWAYEDFSTRGLYRIDNGSVQKYDYTNSPITSYVQGICADVGGYIWVTTLAELIRTDGTHWEVYNPGNSGMPGPGNCWSPARAPDGKLWLAAALNDDFTWSGLVRFNRGDTSWVRYDSTNSSLKACGVVAVTSRNVIWVGYFRGDGYPPRGAVVRYDGQNWVEYNRDNSPLPHEQIYDISIDWNDNPWISCASEGMAVIYDNPLAAEESHKPQAASSKPSAWPNPFRLSATIRLGAPGTATTNVTLVDAAGRVVRTLQAGRGESSVVWDGRDFAGQRVAPGVYFTRVRSEDGVSNCRLVLAR